MPLDQSMLSKIIFLISQNIGCGCTKVLFPPKEQSDLGPYCLQYRLSKNFNISRQEKQTTKVMPGLRLIILTKLIFTFLE